MKEDKKTMDLYTAVMTIEEPSEETTDEDLRRAWQWLIDTGHCWSLQGFYGRSAMRLIEDGLCTPPNTEESSNVET
jgi:hypothetical protein